MSRARTTLGRGVAGGYRFLSRARDKALNVAWRGAFAEFGSHSVLAAPVRLHGEHRISIGSDVYVGAGGYLQVIDSPEGAGRIVIGDGCQMTGGCTLSSASSITLGK